MQRAILLLFASFLAFSAAVVVEKEWYSFNGWYNHPTKPDWGTVDWRMGSRMFPQYGDGGYSPSGVSRPDPLKISSQLFANPQANNPAPSAAGRTVLNAFMAQMLWHEVLDQDRPHCASEPLHILVAKGDPNFDPASRGDRFIPFWRARYDIVTGQNPNVPRMFINGDTSWIDASVIYGNNHIFSNLLRSHQGGQLASSDADGRFPALNKLGLPMKNPPAPREHALANPERLFIFGNKRANENPALLTLQILWFREHNFIAKQIAAANPNLDDFQIYFLARQQVIAEFQHIFLDEWIPNWLGAPLAAYTGWKTSSPPGINTEFSIAFRYGETMIPPGIFRRDPKQVCLFTNFVPPQDGTQRPAARLCNLYWNAQDIFADGADIDDVILGMSSQIAEAEDQFFVEDLRVFSYGNLEFSRKDLMAVHLQRGRDFGLGDFNLARVNYGLAPFVSFQNFTNNALVNQQVQELYQNNISNVDMFVGGMLESQGGPGPLWNAIFRDTFERIRDGDRLWFENTLTGLFNTSEIAAIKALTFKTIILRNTKINANFIQNNPFLSTGTPCPQPFQLAPQQMESCVPLKDYDYFSTSYSHIPVVVVGILFYFICLGLIVFLMVIRKRGLQSSIVNNVNHSIVDFSHQDGTTSYAAIMEEREGESERRQTVFLTLRHGRLLVEDDKQKFLREINVINIEKVKLGGSKGSANMLICIPKEYDLLIEFSDSMRRHNFYLSLSKSKNQQLFAENSSYRSMKRNMKSKGQRKKELKKFFKRAIEGVVSRGDNKSPSFPAEVYEEQLSADEFADSFAIPKNSLFVKQLYALVDKEQKGYVTFREFLDFMGVFYNGSSEEKLSFLFDLYDTERQGAISRDALAKMLKSNMDIANAQHMEKDSVHKIVDMIFQELGLNSTQKIKFNDFKEFIGRTGANMAITVKDEYQTKPREKKGTFAAPKATTAEAQENYTTLRINQNMRNALQGKADKSHQYYTVLYSADDIQKSFAAQGNPLQAMTSAYGEGNLGPNIKNIEATPGEDLSSFKRGIAFVRDNRTAVFILVMYAFAGAILFAERAFTITTLKENTGFRRYIGEIVTTTAKGGAQNMMFNYSLLLLTMCRNIFTVLRSSKIFGIPLHKYIPFDGIYTFHKLVATVALFWAIVHTLAHFINFFHLSSQPPEVLLCLIREYFWYSDELPSFGYWLLFTIPGSTGVLLLAVIFILHAFSFQYARKNVFGAFWTTHHVCAVLLYILTVLHGVARILAPPAFYIWLIPPAFIFLIDRCISVTRMSLEVPVVEVEILPSGVTKIVYKRPDDFEYKAGQWIRIACAAISPNEFHPFTMTSAPHERHLMNHIRAVGPWTNALREVYNPSSVRLGSLPHVRIDGPYGEGHQEWNANEIVVMVGGGIGVTPFAAILKDIVHQSCAGTNIFMKKAYFFWVCRNQKQFEWLVDIIRECENKDLKNLLEVHIFITELQHKYDLRTTMLHICERTFQKIAKKSLFTGCKAATHFGRPNFTHLFSQLQQTHSDVRKIGVFSCGPPALTYSVEDGTNDVNTLSGPRFHHHFENF